MFGIGWFSKWKGIVLDPPRSETCMECAYLHSKEMKDWKCGCECHSKPRQEEEDDRGFPVPEEFYQSG